MELLSTPPSVIGIVNEPTTAINTPGSERSAFKHRPIGRCASPPIWGCYELDTGSNSCSDSDSEAESGDECDSDGPISIVVAPVILEVDPANIPLPPSPLPEVFPELATIIVPEGDTLVLQNAGTADDSPQEPSNSKSTQEDCTVFDPSLKLDKGKGREVVLDALTPTPASVSPPEQCSPSTPATRRTRRNSRSNRRTQTYRPILTIRSSHGWLWNQELFVPSYMKDRYISFPPEPLPTDPQARDHDYDCIGITLTPEDLGQVLPP